MIKKVTKRDGRLVDFNQEKITNAILKAAKATGEFKDKKIAKELTAKVLKKIEKKTNISVEEIQDSVEDTLILSKYKKTAKAYIIYRDQHQKMREIENKSQISLIDKYLEKLDWQVKENSNMAYSLQGLNNYIASEVSKTYWLNKIYPKNIKEALV